MKGTSAKAVFCAALGNIIWGFSFLFTRVGLDVTTPNIMLAHRFTVATLVSLAMIPLGGQRLSFRGLSPTRKWMCLPKSRVPSAAGME